MKGIIAAGILWLALGLGAAVVFLLAVTAFLLCLPVLLVTWPFRRRPRVVALAAPPTPAAPCDEAAMFAAYEREMPRRVQRLADRIPPLPRATR